MTGGKNTTMYIVLHIASSVRTGARTASTLPFLPPRNYDLWRPNQTLDVLAKAIPEDMS